MSNEIAKRPGTEADPFARHAENTRSTAIVGKLLKFAKGEWFSGQNNDPVPAGSKFVANMDELLVGWIRWYDNKPTDHVMGRVVDAFQPPRRHELGDLDQNEWELDNSGQPRDPWQESNYLLLMSADDDNELYTFASGSKGGKNAIGALCLAFSKGRIEHKKEWPVVKISGSSYRHPNKQLGTISFPVFEIVGWVSKASFEAVAKAAAAAEGGEEEDEAAPLPPTLTKAPERTKVKARF